MYFRELIQMYIEPVTHFQLHTSEDLEQSLISIYKLKSVKNIHRFLMDLSLLTL